MTPAKIELLLLLLSGLVPESDHETRDKILLAKQSLREMQALPVRGDVGKAEATRDPIFLLETAYYDWTINGIPDEIVWSDNYDGFVLRSDLSDKDPDDIEVLSDAKIGEKWPDHLVKKYVCRNHVFFTREEAESWARARTYRWPAGWRVWCCCAEGDLAKILRTFTRKPTGDVA